MNGKEGSRKEEIRSVGKEGRPKGRHITLWVLDDPVTTYTTSSRVLAGKDIYEEFIRRNNEHVAQERRARSRANLLDTVSAASLRNIR